MSNYSLQLLHAADMEGGGGDLLNAPNFVSIVDYLEDQNPNTLTISPPVRCPASRRPRAESRRCSRT